jgi:prophage maintenance system killer protein
MEIRELRSSRSACFSFKNGYLLNAHDAEATQAMFALAAGDLTEEELVEWIRRYSSAGKG